jgi:hypothetical protein
MKPALPGHCPGEGSLGRAELPHPRGAKLERGKEDWRIMSDTYIDYYEVSEYGRHFIREVAALEGMDGVLVDLGRVKARVQTTVEAVEAALQVSSTQGSSVREGRGVVDRAAEVLRDRLKRFYFHLQSVPVGTRMDVHALFPGAKLGLLSRRKPADLVAYTDTVLRGFDSPANRDLPQGQTWKTMLSQGRGALVLAMEGKGTATTGSQATTGVLARARQDFLRFYNKVAKPLVRGVLADLGREHEYRRFFLDLQVGEGARAPRSGPLPGEDSAVVGEHPGYRMIVR